MIFTPLYLLLLFVICYVLGSLITKPFYETQAQPFTSLFLKLTVGLLLTVASYSIIITSGNTIMWGVLILPLLIFKPTFKLLSIKEFTNGIKTETLPIGIFLAFSCIWWFFNNWFLYDSHFNFPIPPFVDYVFYANLSDQLNNTGVETAVLDLNQTAALHASPYHYFELWLTALLSRSSNNSTIYFQQLVTHVFLFSLCGLGIAAIQEHFNVKSKSKLFYLLTIFVLGISFPFFFGIAWGVLRDNFTASYFSYGIILLPKIAPIAIICILTLLFIIKSQYSNGILSVLILPFISIVTAPVILIFATIVTVLILLFKKQSLNHKVIFIAIFTSFFYLIGFYLFNNWHDANYLDRSNITFNTEYINVIVSLKNTLKYCWPILYSFLPLWIGLLLLILFKKRKKDVVTLSILIALSLTGSAIWAFSDFMLDTAQMSVLVIVPVLSITTFHLAIRILNDPDFNKSVKAIIVIIGSFWISGCIWFTTNKLIAVKDSFKNTYSHTYLNQVSSVIKNKHYKGGVIKAKADFTNPYSLNQTTFSYPDYLTYINKNISITGLNVEDEMILDPEPRTREQQQLFISQQPFPSYVQMHPEVKNTNEARLKYIKQYGLTFLIISKQVELDTTLTKLVSQEITDDKSGERLLILNQ